MPVDAATERPRAGLHRHPLGPLEPVYAEDEELGLIPDVGCVNDLRRAQALAVDERTNRACIATALAVYTGDAQTATTQRTSYMPRRPMQNESLAVFSPVTVVRFLL